METQKPKTTPKDFFLWLGAMATLYGSVIALVTLFFSYIDRWFPDPLAYGDSSDALRFGVSALVVVFPLYVFLTRVLHQDLRAHPEKKDLWVRRWLVFATLFIGGFAVVIDLVALINVYLQGELTTRFALKCLAILLVVGGGFLYYAYELKGTWERKESLSKIIAAAVSAVVLATVIGVFFVIDSPMAQRLIRLDQQRVSDLQNIQWQVINYWQQKEKLPGSMDDLEDPLTGFIAPKDPETHAPYVYRPGEGMSFELCATFGAESVEDPNTTRPAYPDNFYDENWKHGVGEACFERVIDPDRFPPYPTKI